MPVTRVRAAKDADDVRRYLAARQPATTEMLASLSTVGVGRRLQVWAVTDGGGRLCGAVVRTRLVADRWYAHVHLDDVAHAADVAAVLHGTSVTAVTALAPTIDALRPHLPRLRGVRRSWGYVVEPQPLPGTVESVSTLVEGVDIRPAVPADLGPVFGLHLHWPTAAGAAPLRRLHGHLRRVIAGGGMLVAVEGGEVVGVIQTRPRTDRYAVISGLVVAPDERGIGIGVALATYGMAGVLADGLGTFALRRSRTRLPYPAGMDVELEHPLPFATAALHPLARFRGHRRLTTIVERGEDALFRRFGQRQGPAL